MRFEWQKSSYSGGDPDNQCVEVASNVPELRAIRDSKDPHGPHLEFTPAAFRTFLTALKHNPR